MFPRAIVSSILEPDGRSTLDRLAAQPAGDDVVVEVRADHLDAATIAHVVREAGRPLIVTVRRPEDGGAFDGSEAERAQRLTAALDAGVAWIDVEWNRGLRELCPPERGPRIVLSHHGAPCEASDLARLAGEMSAVPSALVKIVPEARRLDDGAAIRELVARAVGRGDPPLAAFASGRPGLVTRLLTLAWGGRATYAAARGGVATAPGQVDVDALREPFAVTGITASTRLFGLIGADLTRSPSAAMHRAGYRALGLDARYLPLECATFDELERALAAPGFLPLAAFGATMPHKEAAARWCADLDPFAAASRSANTVLRRSDGWFGANTDAPAAVEAIERYRSLDGARVALVGAGGTATAVAAALADRGARIAVFNRSVDRARRLANRVGGTAAPAEALAGARWEVLVQATPLGARGERWFHPQQLTGEIVVDFVYGGRPTPLLEDAASRGLATVDGAELLVRQGVRQFEWMTGQPVDPAVLRQAQHEWWAGAGADGGQVE